MPECCVFSDMAETFLLGVCLPLSGEDWFVASLFWSLLLGENCEDFISVGVPNLDPGRGKLMKPYRSISAPSTSSQSSMPPANSVSLLATSGDSKEEAPDLGVLWPARSKPRKLL